MKVKVKYVSSWEEGGLVETDAVLDLKSGEIIAEAVSVDVEHLIEEYIMYKSKDYSVLNDDGCPKLDPDVLRDFIFDYHD